MNILITGGTGLIGKKLVEILIEEHKVTVLTRNRYSAAELFDNTVRLIEKLTLNDIEGQDAVINLAGEPIADKRWSKKQKTAICQSRWSITQQLTSLMRDAENPPSLFISGSAIGIYGRQSTAIIDESFTTFHKEFTHTVCSKWEQLALDDSLINTRIATLRTGIVLDRDGGALGKMLLPFKLGLGGKIATGEQVMSWIHIDDMIAAIMHIMNTPTLSGPINMTSEHAVTNKEFARILSKKLNRPSFCSTPAFVLKLIFGEMADLLLFGQNVIPTRLCSTGFLFQYPTLDDALTNILEQP